MTISLGKALFEMEILSSPLFHLLWNLVLYFVAVRFSFDLNKFQMEYLLCARVFYNTDKRDLNTEMPPVTLNSECEHMIMFKHRKSKLWALPQHGFPL